MADENPTMPETTDIPTLVEWLGSVAPAGTSEETVASDLATGLFYEAQKYLETISAAEDMDFYSEAADRSPGETGLAWANRTAGELVRRLGEDAAAPYFMSAAHTAVGLLATKNGQE